jgi:hypothetical protein
MALPLGACETGGVSLIIASLLAGMFVGRTSISQWRTRRRKSDGIRRLRAAWELGVRRGLPVEGVPGRDVHFDKSVGIDDGNLIHDSFLPGSTE